MQRAKAFFLVCAGVFLLALSYHLGAQQASAQAPGNPIVAAADNRVFLSNGDVYEQMGNPSDWVHTTNIFNGPTPPIQQSWGSMKARYRSGAAPQSR